MYDKLITKFNAMDTSKLVQKADYNTKIQEAELKISDKDKYITNSEFNKLNKEKFDEKLKQANLSS